MTNYDLTNKGYIYVLSNASYNGMYKVGLTTRTVEERVSELSGSTGVPTPFVIEYFQEFNDCVEAEKNIHMLLELADGRVANNREFFEVPLEKIIETIEYVKNIFDSQTTHTIASTDTSLTKANLYINQALEVIERERMFGGEKKAEQKLIEAAKLNSPEAYSLLGDLYSNSSFESTYDLDRAVEMYIEVLNIENGIISSESFSAMSYISIMEINFNRIDELYEYINDLSYINDFDEKYYKIKEVEGVIESFRKVLFTIWKMYIKAFERDVFKNATIKELQDFLLLLDKYFFSTSFRADLDYQPIKYIDVYSREEIGSPKFVNSLAYYIINRRNNISEKNEVLNRLKSHWFEMLHDFVKFYNDEDKLLRLPEVRVLSINEISPSKVEIEVEILKETIYLNDTFAIISNDYRKDAYSTTKVLFLKEIINDNQTSDKLTANEVGKLVFEFPLNEMEPKTLRQDDSSLKVIGNCSDTLPETNYETGITKSNNKQTMQGKRNKNIQQRRNVSQQIKNKDRNEINKNINHQPKTESSKNLFDKFAEFLKWN